MIINNNNDNNNNNNNSNNNRYIYIYSKLFKGVYDTFPYINWEMMPLPPLHRPFGASEISGASKWLVLHMETYN